MSTDCELRRDTAIRCSDSLDRVNSWLETGRLNVALPALYSRDSSEVTLREIFDEIERRAESRTCSRRASSKALITRVCDRLGKNLELVDFSLQTPPTRRKPH